MPVDVIGREALMAKFNASLRTMEAEKASTLRKSALTIHSDIRERIREEFKERSGHLAGSVRVFNETKNGISIGTGRGLDYAEPLELGAIEHPIVARRAPQLVFFWEREGRMFYGPAVVHPGNRPYRYVYGGFMQAMPQVYRYSCELVTRAFRVAMT